MLGREHGLVRVVEDGCRGRDIVGLESPLAKLGQFIIDCTPWPLANSLSVLVSVWVVRVDESRYLRKYHGSCAVLAF